MRYHLWHDILGNPNIRKGDKPKRPADIFKLPTDVREIPTTDISVNDEEVEALKKIGLLK